MFPVNGLSVFPLLSPVTHYLFTPTMNHEELWQAVLGDLETVVSKANFITWLKDTSVADIRDNVVIVRVPNFFTKEWLENKFHKDIMRALRKVYPHVKNAEYIIGKVEPRPKQEAVPHPIINPTIPAQRSSNALPGQTQNNLNPKYTFDSFIIGSHNELARAACLSVAEQPGQAYNPLFIYGGVGLGKTHLLQAVGNTILDRDPNRIITYVSSEIFTSEMVNAIKQQKIEDFKRKYRQVDVLIIDDIQFLAGKEKTQEEFFHTFNALHSAGKQVILSSDRPPKSIPTLEERLRSRFEGGMIADVGHPDFETRLAILRKKADDKNFSAPHDVLEYIATNVQQNIRELEGALNRVIVSCQLNNVEPSVERAKNILSGLIQSPKRKATTPERILETVANFYNIDQKMLLDRCRKKEVVNPRQIAMYLMREEIQTSFPSIGEHFGGRDHTTAMHAYDKIKKESSASETLRQELNLLKERLYLN